MRNWKNRGMENEEMKRRGKRIEGKKKSEGRGRNLKTNGSRGDLGSPAPVEIAAPLALIKNLVNS